MMWDPQNQEGTFRETMQDFVKTYANKPASTEDFKAMVEKHMPASIDLEGNHRLDWFFNQYVYGTALPSYKFEHSFAQTPQGVVLNFKLTQSDVDENFKMLVPLYLELADGNVIRLGSMPILGNKTVVQSVPLPVKDMPKRAMVNYLYDVLALQDRGAPSPKKAK
jgi:aminopeptidase N